MALDCVSVATANGDDTRLDDSPFLVSWLIDTLKATDPGFMALTQKHKILSAKAVNISGGRGYVSKVYRCSIEFESNQPDYDVILKVPGMDAMNDAFDAAGKENPFEGGDQFVVFHNNECEFYQKYAPEIKYPTPKVFSSRSWVRNKQVGYILMEDLSTAGMNASIFAGLSINQLLVCARHIAHFQYYFLSLADQSWQDRFAAKNNFDSQGIIDFTLPLFDKLVDMRPATFRERIKPICEAAKHIKFQSYILTEHSKDIGVPYVLSHGDLWSNNIMWKLDEHGNITNDVAAIIDFQIVHTGSITNDLARVLVCCTDADVRREHETAVLRCYYDTLAALYQKDDSEVPFSFDQVKAAYKFSQLTQTLDALWMVPLFCCGEQEPGSEAIWEARTEKLLLRASMALNDALETLETIPNEKIRD